MFSKQIATALIVLLSANLAYCQNILDAEKYKDAELFVVKKDYDISQRLQEINSILGKAVTVYQVSGKQNKISLSYTGTAEASKVEKFSDKQKASLIVVKTKGENGAMRAYFPLTNDRRYRIYLTEKMK
jgi:hypothetical protein